MKPTLPAIAFLFVSLSVLCRANIGETEAQCIARYGPESAVRTDLGFRQVGDKAVSFSVKTPTVGYDIRVTFLNGSSCHESFCNSDSSQGLSADQMKAVLATQSAGLKWDKKKEVLHTGTGTVTYGTVDWLRSDGATAKFWLSGPAATKILSGQVDLSTSQYAKAQSFYDKENGN